MKSSILIQLDTDSQPSVFDAVVAVDAGVGHLLRHGGVKPGDVQALVHGALFTRGPGDLNRSAVFVGGSDVSAGEAVLKAVTQTFFGPFQVSVLFDPNGCNTTAAAAVLAAIDGASQTRVSIEGATVAVLGATGPVGQRVARLLLRQGESVQVRVGSRRLDRATATASLIREVTDRESIPFATADNDSLAQGIEGADVIVSAGAAGALLLPESVWRSSTAKVLIDLNAVPPLGVEGVSASDRGKDLGGILAWGALGVGATKMKIHKNAVAELFTSNTKVIDAEQCLAIGRALA